MGNNDKIKRIMWSDENFGTYGIRTYSIVGERSNQIWYNINAIDVAVVKYFEEDKET